MYSKMLISGSIETVSGLHIGTGGGFSAIGAADSPVIRDAVTRRPMIPGSSLKGKLRTLLAKKLNTSKVSTYDDDCDEILRLFGGMKKTGRAIFSDMYLENMDELEKSGIYEPTEIKFENNINRLSAIANPRQIERVIRSCRFGFRLIYNIEDDVKISEIEEDIKNLCDGMTLLTYDYLGGSGSRGYGKIKFKDLNAEFVVGNDDGEFDNILDNCNKLLGSVGDL
ncbi:MAG: type III-A CRISPR-associated RAMP protein Csm3 [Ruminococcus sp.]|nr:type III-A CRISPR-associated RAMP protein Csm3 [Ruminococcus sp.]